MAAMTALDALSIDSMIPALAQIDADLGMSNPNQRQWIVTSLFFGFALGVLVFGFVADAIGRRAPVMCAFAIFVVGTLICMQSTNLGWMLAGRVCQGVGASGPYVLSIAIVRDTYQGRKMARVMSLVMMVFIGAPIVAPFIGQLVLMVAGWRSIFGVLLAFCVAIALWFWRRQPETLAVEKRVPLKLKSIASNACEVLGNRQSRTYTIAMALAGGAFIAYLSTAQQIFQEIYQTGNSFPAVFASLASTIGLSSWLNSRWVETLGMARLLGRALLMVFCFSVLYLIGSLLWSATPPFWFYYLYLAGVIFSYGLIFSNLTSLALEPMGHIAGAASSVVNSVGTIGSLIVAATIGANLHNSVTPVVVGFGLACLLAWLLVRKIDRPVPQEQ